MKGSDVFLCDYVRTPIGRFAGALSGVRADDLAAIPISGLLERNRRLDWSALDDVVLGCANQAGEDNRNIARMALLLAGLPVTVPGTTINRLCASGMDAIIAGARAIACGEAALIVAGGVESMSRAPFVVPKQEKPFSRQAAIYDTTIGWRFVNPAMTAAHGTDSMPETAENVAIEYGVSREDQDAFALASQRRTAGAQSSGRLAEEIVPVTILRGKGEVLEIAEDEHPRPDCTAEALGRLKPLHPGGSVTAGNSSGVNDGAAALLLASGEAVKTNGLTPIARIVGGTAVGVPPRLMGIGPAPAAQKLIDRLGLSMAQVDVFEVNEAFASQALATIRQLGLEDGDSRVNPNGGAIALGHPLGMSGARIAGTAALELRRCGGKRALAAMCVGVGQGVAIAIESA